MSLLVRSETLGLFIDPLTADAKYSSHVTENFLKPFQMHLS